MPVTAVVGNLQLVERLLAMGVPVDFRNYAEPVIMQSGRVHSCIFLYVINILWRSAP